MTHRPTLFWAFERGGTTWPLGFTTGMAPRPRERTMRAGDGHGLGEAMTQARRRSGSPDDARVLSGCEAGREGCWLHRSANREGLLLCLRLCAQRQHTTMVYRGRDLNKYQVDEADGRL